ncbi:nucleoid-associated protein [Olsenella sp. Marseille-P4559]|uniref:nucleoid-associated protein n=1 Tax=Olsenella sp. Marseille-P4559 TaxID=2364795 RepID=UPI001030B0C3|nr:nucleoid-associated protein [Olsenella sp. Marseille-P4559]
MLRIGHAILHVFDFESGSTFFSQSELDLDNRQTRSYVTRRLRRICSSAESKHGTFAPESNFASGLKEYFAGRVSFADFSVQIAQWFWEELRRAEDLEQCDLLVADFTDTGDMRASANADEDAVADAYESEGTHLFAVVLLPRKQAFIHEVDENGNEIARQDATLPNPTQKVNTYVLINAETLDIDFHDKERSAAGEPRQIIPELFLQCTQEASSHEVIDEVTSIVVDLSEEYGLTAAVEVSRAKAALARRADADEAIQPADVGREVFEDNPEMAQRFEERTREHELPEEVPVRRGAANRLTRTHRIRTDTGVEIAFPSELAERPGYIDFAHQEDGSISIVISNVARIENR